MSAHPHGHGNIINPRRISQQAEKAKQLTIWELPAAKSCPDLQLIRDIADVNLRSQLVPVTGATHHHQIV